MNFIACVQAERIKSRRSFAAWLVIIGGFFTPSIMFLAGVLRPDATAKALSNPAFWERYWMNSWESVAMFLLPVGIILAASLITQVEYRNNTWKQLHTSPQRYTTIFLAKLFVLIVMYLQFIVLFNLGVYLSGVLQGLFIEGAIVPAGFVFWKTLYTDNLDFFITGLPIIAFQFLISLQFKNFLVPIGAGLAVWIASIAAIPWKYNYLLPYGHGSLTYLVKVKRFAVKIQLNEVALLYALFFIIFAYILYITKKEKG